MRIRCNGRYLSLLFVLLLVTGCASSGAQHTLAHDGGILLILHAACLPAAPGCDLAKQRDAAITVLTRRLDERTDAKNAVVRADGTTNITVALPGVGSANTADIEALLTGNGAVAFLDTRGDGLNVGTSTAGKTCTTVCQPGQYPIVFTGGQLDRDSIAAQTDSSGQWAVTFSFGGTSRQKFADYTASRIGDYLTITANDVVVESATIQSEISGAGQIGGLSQDEARRLAAYLKSGPLPAAVSVASAEQITPTAG